MKFFSFRGPDCGKFQITRMNYHAGNPILRNWSVSDLPLPF